MTPLRLGIVGAGSIVAKKHLLALAEVPEIAVVGLCRRDVGELQALADRFRVPRRYADYRDLLSDPGIDAVLIATGPAAQPEIAMAAAAAGKHVFAEKPMAATAAEARALAGALRHSPVHVQIGFNKRFYYGYRTAQAPDPSAGSLARPPGSMLGSGSSPAAPIPCCTTASISSTSPSSSWAPWTKCSRGGPRLGRSPRRRLRPGPCRSGSEAAPWAISSSRPWRPGTT